MFDSYSGLEVVMRIEMGVVSVEEVAIRMVHSEEEVVRMVLEN